MFFRQFVSFVALCGYLAGCKVASISPPPAEVHARNAQFDEKTVTDASAAVPASIAINCTSRNYAVERDGSFVELAANWTAPVEISTFLGTVLQAACLSDTQLEELLKNYDTEKIHYYRDVTTETSQERMAANGIPVPDKKPTDIRELVFDETAYITLKDRPEHSDMLMRVSFALGSGEFWKRVRGIRIAGEDASVIVLGSYDAPPENIRAVTPN
jgi:hypothetical protein